MVGYTPSNFTDLVFASKKIEVGLNRGKVNPPAWTNEKTVANEEGEDEGETHAMTAIPVRPSFPPAQQCHYSTNNNPVLSELQSEDPSALHSAQLSLHAMAGHSVSSILRVTVSV